MKFHISDQLIKMLLQRRNAKSHILKCTVTSLDISYQVLVARQEVSAGNLIKCGLTIPNYKLLYLSS
jgi:hypothetical protein